MTSEETLLTLRHDLLEAAEKLVIRRRQRRRRLGISFVALFAVAFATAAASAALWAWGTSGAQPTQTVVATQTSSAAPPPNLTASGTASERIDALHSGAPASLSPSEEQTINGFTRAFGAIDLRNVRQLASLRGVTLKAVATDRGAVCMVISVPSESTGSCALDLPGDHPILPLVAVNGTQTTVGVLAADEVSFLEVVGPQGERLCQGRVVSDGFVCVIGAAAQVAGFSVRTSSGAQLQIPF